MPLRHPACTGCDEVFHQPHQPRNTEACTARDEMPNPVVTDVEPFEKPAYSQHSPYDLDPTVDGQNHVAYVFRRDRDTANS